MEVKPCPVEGCKGTLYPCLAKHVDEQGSRYHCSWSPEHTFMPFDLGETEIVLDSDESEEIRKR